MGNNRPPKSPRGRNNRKKYHQGFYNIINLDKYIGDPKKCIYRSKWELHFMAWCDKNTSIKRWGSEHITIPYQDEKGKFHRYYPDFYIEIIDRHDPEKLERVVIEIKPAKETQKPVPPKKITAKSLETYEYQLKTYQKNLYKWTKAKYWCDKHKMKFNIITENYLTEKKIM
ncbi:MAG: head completion protein [Candidatus Muirbacterium halophilum]|nr:head completion protein [Candidatus Muirbacterium halophilum]